MRNEHVASERSSVIILAKYYSLIKKQVNFKVAVPEMYPRSTLWELLVERLVYLGVPYAADCAGSHECTCFWPRSYPSLFA